MEKSYPPAPAPTCSSRDVQNFFTDIFLANDDTLTRRRAKERAEMLRVNGEGLYMSSQEDFERAFAHHGKIIYYILQDGKYGPVSQLSKND